MPSDDHQDSGFRTRRRLLKAFGAGGAAVTIGMTPSAVVADDQLCTNGAMPPQLVGQFVDSFGHRHVIDESQWHSFHDDEALLYRICSVHPQKGFLIAQNHRSQKYHPDKFSRFEWVVEDGDVWYCQQVYSADSQSAAVDFARFPAAIKRHKGPGGCGVSGLAGWTKLTAGTTD